MKVNYKFKKVIVFFIEVINGEPVKQVRRYGNLDKAQEFIENLLQNPERQVVGEIELKVHYAITKGE